MDAVDNLGTARRQFRTGGSHRDDARATVGARRFTFGQARLLQRVDGDHHRRLVHVAEFGELRLRAFSCHRVDQHAVHPGREPDLGQRRRHLRTQDVAGAVE